MIRGQSIIIGVGPHGTETIQALQSQSLSNAQFAIAGGHIAGVQSIPVAQQDMGSEGSSIFQDAEALRTLVDGVAMVIVIGDIDDARSEGITTALGQFIKETGKLSIGIVTGTNMDTATRVQTSFDTLFPIAQPDASTTITRLVDSLLSLEDSGPFISVTFKDITDRLQGKGLGSFGCGEGASVAEAIDNALQSIDNPITGSPFSEATSVLFLFSTTMDTGFFDIHMGAQQVTDAAHPESYSTFGWVPHSGTGVRVGILATG